MTLDDSVPLDPKTFGEELRRVRESSGLELEDISAETKISRRILEALEAGSFRALPERVFCRSFVAQVAATIGIDETPLVAAFDRAWETYATDSGIHLDFRLETAELAPSIRWRFWIPIATGAAILLVAGWVILRGSASVSDGLQPDPRRSGASQVAAEQPTRPPTPPMPHQTATAAVDEPVDDESVVRMTLEVNQGEECWIHYRDGEGMTGQQLLGGGERYSLELPGPVKLTVGNAGAVRVSVDGQTFQDLGLPGQVIHTQVTGAGVTPLRTGGLGG